MTHIILEVDEAGNPATWGDHVTEDEYAQAQRDGEANLAAEGARYTDAQQRMIDR